MKTIVNLDTKTVVLISKDVDEEVDMDQILQIDYTNIYGEIITNSVLLNKIGLLRADAQAAYDSLKLEYSISESKLKRSLRREAILNGGKVNLKDEGQIKLTESSLDEIVLGDVDLQEIRQELIERKRDLDYMDSLFWSIKSKDQKLNFLVPKITPKELFDELIEGTINTITIKKM